MDKKLIDLIREKFKERLQAKTGWGRLDILSEYDRAVTDALLELRETPITN